MSTQIQQQQVQGLVVAVSDVAANAGNLVMSGASLLADIAATGYALDTDIDTVSGDLLATGAALSSDITNNTNNLLNTGKTLSVSILDVELDLVDTGTTLGGRIDTTGATLTANLVTTGAVLSGNLVTTGAVLSGNVVATGATLGDRLGQNYQKASNLGVALSATDTINRQLYGEVLMSVHSGYICSNRILQWVGDVPPGTTSGLYLGGAQYNSSGDLNLARMEQNSQWFVKMYCNAKSIEVMDRRSKGHTGISWLETGLIIDNEGGAGSSTYLTGINGNSGVAGSGIHYEFQIGTSGVAPGHLLVSGHNSYTGTVRFHATAYVSELDHAFWVG